MIGGGFQIFNGDIEIHESHPSSAGNGWLVKGFNRLIDFGSNSLVAHAVCASAN